MIRTFAIILCDRCEDETVDGPSRAVAAREARSQGWKIGRRSRRSPRIDLCPACRVEWRGGRST
jgi:hypothetical protein